MEATGVGEYVGFFMRLGGAKLRVLEHFGFPKCHALWPHRPRCRTSEAPDGRGPVRTTLAELISQASAIWKKKPISVPTYGPVWACHWRRRSPSNQAIKRLENGAFLHGNSLNTMDYTMEFIFAPLRPVCRLERVLCT